MYSKFMWGAPLLTGSNTVPGQILTQEEKDIYLQALQGCTEWGF